MDGFTEACALLPQELGQALKQIPQAEEVRLRLGRPAAVLVGGRERPLSEDGVSRRQLERIMEKATGASVHAAVDAMRGGYVSYRGLRIGICGEVATEGHEAFGFRSFSSLAVRIPRADCRFPGDLFDRLLEGGAENTLLLAPPGVGKTSLLRELIRRSSERGWRVSVIDEKNELSATLAGQAQFELGPCSDILTGLKKLPASMMLLRGMNPQIIAMDEISSPEDLEAVRCIIGCGVTLFATAHGRSRRDMLSRPQYRELLDAGCFRRFAVIRLMDGRREYTVERAET